MSIAYWIEGFPATFATSRENLWKQKNIESLNHKQFNEDCIQLEFVLSKTNFEKYQYDIDNLCEPVFAVLTSSLGWFNGKRKNIGLWTAKKSMGDTQGLYIRDIDANTFLTPTDAPVFDAVYNGPFPNKATDNSIPNWIDRIGNYKKVDKKCSIKLQFGDPSISIATISSGKVKPIIDCLYPIIGGMPGTPTDEKIELLTVERQSKNIDKNIVKITIWES